MRTRHPVRGPRLYILRFSKHTSFATILPGMSHSGAVIRHVVMNSLNMETD